MEKKTSLERVGDLEEVQACRSDCIEGELDIDWRFQKCLIHGVKMSMKRFGACQHALTGPLSCSIRIEPGKMKSQRIYPEFCKTAHFIEFVVEINKTSIIQKDQLKL